MSISIIVFSSFWISRDGAQPAELLHAATENITSAELQFAEEELKNSNKTRDK